MICAGSARADFNTVRHGSVVDVGCSPGRNRTPGQPLRHGCSIQLSYGAMTFFADIPWAGASPTFPNHHMWWVNFAQKPASISGCLDYRQKYLSHNFPKQLLPDPRHRPDQPPLGVYERSPGCRGSLHHQAAQRPVIGVQVAQASITASHTWAVVNRLHGRPQRVQDHPPGIAFGARTGPGRPCGATGRQDQRPGRIAEGWPRYDPGLSWLAVSAPVGNSIKLATCMRFSLRAETTWDSVIWVA